MTLNVYFPVGLGLHEGQRQGGCACAPGGASSADANTAVRSGLRIRTPAGGRVRSGQPQVRSGPWPGLRNGLPTAAAGHNGTGKGRVTRHRSTHHLTHRPDLSIVYATAEPVHELPASPASRRGLPPRPHHGIAALSHLTDCSANSSNSQSFFLFFIII